MQPDNPILANGLKRRKRIYCPIAGIKRCEAPIVYLIVLSVLALVLYGIFKAVTGERYSEMTNGEFEAEAKHASKFAPVLTSIQKMVDPNHHVEYVQEEKERIRADSAQSGKPPKAGPAFHDQNYRIPD